jgi:hypothetical protein
MDCPNFNINDIAFGTQDWPDHLRVHAAIYRGLSERIDNPLIKNELLHLASVCEEVADQIEDYQTRH